MLLQQVLVNLVINAMDAMAETPPARRRITISTEVRAADVEVSVRDTGTGVPAQISLIARRPTCVIPSRLAKAINPRPVGLL